MKKHEATINAAFDPASPTSGIQEAIDALGKGGGCVRIPAGQWPLRRSIVLSSRVQLVGDGPATQLTAAPPNILRLARDVRKGARSVHVRGRVPFAPGDGVTVVDNKRQWEIGTHAVVTAIEGGLVRLSRPLVHGIRVEQDARIVSVFPGITKSGAVPANASEPIYDVVVRDLALHGANASVVEHYGDYTLSAIHLVNCHRTRITRVSIFDWLSDGISIQGGADVQVTHCQVRGNSCMGFHPGGGLKRSIWVDDLGIHPNANEKERGGYMITGNMLRNNSREEPGKWPAMRLHNARGFLVQGNRCADDQQKPTQTRGIVESGDSDWNLISGNMCMGMEEAVTVVGPNSRAEGNLG